MKQLFAFLLLITMIGCIGDDIILDEVDPVIRVTSSVQSLKKDTTFQFEFNYFDNAGRSQDVTAIWSSSDDEIISITESGLATAVAKGVATISVEYSEGEITVNDQIEVEVTEETVIVVEQKEGTIRTTSSYRLEGDFVITKTDDGITIEIADNYSASTALPGLYVYLTNNPASTADALNLGKVAVFQGAHTYEVADVGLNDYSHILYFCKPFNVKVGDGEIK